MYNQNNTEEDLGGKIIFNKYKPEQKLGEGSFGKIYSAVNTTNGERYALKMERKDSSQGLLENEAYFLCYLKGFGIPIVKSFGFSGNYNVMVMELLGKSLEDLFQLHGKRFSLKTVCMIAEQMINRLEFIHNKHIIHRDIKPDNFVNGLGQKAITLYILDFGLAKKYRSSRTLQHIKFTINKKLTGTARYASINALRGCEQSRRDDLEAIGYVFVYFLKGALPWQGLRVERKEDRYKKIYEKKKMTTPEELCKGFPEELTEYVRYTRNLEFEQNPDYNYLRGLFKKIMDAKNFNNDLKFDWIKEGFDFNSIEGLPIAKTKNEQNKDDNNEKDDENGSDKVNINDVHKVKKPLVTKENEEMNMKEQDHKVEERLETQNDTEGEGKKEKKEETKGKEESEENINSQKKNKSNCLIV